MGFNRKEYDRPQHYYRDWGEAVINRLRLHGGERILNLGCGDGKLTVQLAEKAPNGFVLGVEASEDLLETAREHESRNLHFMCSEIEELRFRDEFDLVFSNVALHRMKNHRQLLSYALTALRPGGRVVWSLAGDGSFEHFFAIIRAKLNEPAYRDYFQGLEWPWYMPQRMEYEALVDSVGFSEYSLQEIHTDCGFRDPTDLLSWLDILALTPFLSRLPAGLREEFRDEAAVAMIEQTRKAGGIYSESFRNIVLTAWK